jgi:carboxylate-amine ligase
MNRMVPFLPLFLALSVSSPFWQGRDTGIEGYRLTAFAEWPRMGVPEIFSGQQEYDRFVGLLVDAKIIDDASFVWWHIRPSTHYPTIELRVCDSCTRVEDAVAIAALYQSLLRCVARRPDLNAGVGPVDRAICAQNIWLAQQHGTEAHLIDSIHGGAAPVADRLGAALELVQDDAEALRSTAWVARTRDILKRGSSANHQRAVYRDAIAGGADRTEALRKVVRMLAKETAG